MAVLIEGYSVVVRNSTIAARYPDGVEGYERDCPNGSFCSDAHLSRVGFMVQRDADYFVAGLAAKGLTPYRNDAAEDVALLDAVEGLVLPCDWLEVGRYRGVTLAWLAGSEPGDLHAPAGWDFESAMVYMPAHEARERLEFLRSEDDVDVYQDRATGKEYYIGRTEHPSAEAMARHDRLYDEARARIEGLILIHGQQPEELDEDGRRRLEDAIAQLREVVEINPENWAAMWLLGKVYQRLEDYDQGLQWFARAHRVNPDQPDVAREAAIAAMDLGRPEEGLPYCERAVESRPDDPGLRANLALALLFAGRPAEARTAAEDALRRDPDDEITAQIVRIIGDVLDGRRPCPRHIRDLE
jgi:tetratricopeptide (TPR) repeat protein